MAVPFGPDIGWCPVADRSIIARRRCARPHIASGVRQIPKPSGPRWAMSELIARRARSRLGMWVRVNETAPAIPHILFLHRLAAIYVHSSQAQSDLHVHLRGLSRARRDAVLRNKDNVNG